MRQIDILLLALILTGCLGQNKYFEPDGVIDKTEEYVQMKKGWMSLGDNTRVDGYTRLGDSIFGGEIACNVEPLKDIDVETFQVLAGTQYARDKNNVYYPMEVPCIDYSDCGVCFYGKILISDADPLTFKYLGNEYAVDQLNAYFRGEKIENADGPSFKVIVGPEFFYFAIDSNNVYRHNKVFKEADPETFFYDKNDERNRNSEFDPKIIIADAEHEWEYSPPSTIVEIDKN